MDNDQPDTEHTAAAETPASSNQPSTRPDRVHTISHPGGVTSELRVFDVDTAQAAPRAAVLILPGMGMGARYYDPFARALTDAGFAAATMELPGQGTSTVQMKHNGHATGYHDAAYSDIPLALATFGSDMRHRDLRGDDGGDLPIFLLGHSQGGQLAAYYLAREAEGSESLVPHPRVAGLIGVATQSPFYKGFGKKTGRRLHAASYILPAIGAVRGSVPSNFFGFEGTQPSRRITDWAGLARRGTMNPIGADIDYPAGMAKSDKPVLAVTIEGDREAPVAAARNWLDFFGEAPRTMRHVSEPIGHTRWARTPEPVTAYVREWINLQIGVPGSGAPRG